MKRLPSILLLAFISTFLGATILSLMSVGALDATEGPARDGLVELVPGTDYRAWFLDATGYATVTSYFGAYVIAPLGDTLYLGFGRGRPAEADGALLAAYDGTALDDIYQPDEQGFIDMEVVVDKLFFPGPDPCCGDNWDWGNSYVYTDTAVVTKYRNLPNVIHSWGMWYDESEEILYTAVSSHLGDEATWTGELFASTDDAQSWQRVADRDDGVGDYRTYDVQGVQGELFVTWNDEYEEPCGLARSSDAGQTWTRQPGMVVSCRARLFTFQGELLALGGDRTTLYTIAAGGSVTTHTLPGFAITNWAYNPFATDASGYLYTVTMDGRVVRSRNLHAWETVADTGLELITIAYWPDKNWLILGERGQDASVWRLDLGGAPVPPTPVKNIIVLIADGWGANHIAAANAYSGIMPAYQSWPRHWVSTYPAGSGYDPEQAWTTFDYPTQNTTDSAAAATALFTGHKTANGRIASDSTGADRLHTITEQARRLGKAVGAVSSVHISHATPGVWLAHNAVRSNGYAIADEAFWGNPNTTGTIIDHERYGGGLGVTMPPADVVIGAGHPVWNDSYINGAIRAKLAGESGQPGAFLFVERIAGQANGGQRLLAAANLTTTTRLAGLFGGSGGNLEYRLADGNGADSENPTLAEMTTAALATLSRAPAGFVLLVEGGAVDWAAHANIMDRMVGEMLGFNEAVTAVVAWVEDATNGSSWQDTLVIVTGDHETGYLTAAPGVWADAPLGPVNAATLAAEKEMSGTERRASWDDANDNGLIDGDEVVYWAWNSGGHSNSLIPFYAKGPGATLFDAFATGVDPVRGAYLDNTAVYFVMDALLRYRLFLPIVTR